jgi:putative ABC transport system permease protein
MHPSVLRLLRVQPAIGRLPTADAADEDAVVLGWDVWQSLGADNSLIGARVDVDGRAHTIAGVMPDGFGFPERQSFWTVLPAHESGEEVVARVAAGTSPDEVAAAAAARSSALATAQGRSDGPYSIVPERWTTSRDGGGEVVALAALGGLVFLLLLVCCANVATLLLVRGNERATQLAVHAALGATRGRVTLQLFLESVIIAVGGGAIGLAGGFTMLRWMQLNLAQHWGYYWMVMEVRTPVLIGTIVMVSVAALLAGTAPSLRATR